MPRVSPGRPSSSSASLSVARGRLSSTPAALSSSSIVTIADVSVGHVRLQVGRGLVDVDRERAVLERLERRSDGGRRRSRSRRSRADTRAWGRGCLHEPLWMCGGPGLGPGRRERDHDLRPVVSRPSSASRSRTRRSCSARRAGRSPCRFRRSRRSRRRALAALRSQFTQVPVRIWPPGVLPITAVRRVAGIGVRQGSRKASSPRRR